MKQVAMGRMNFYDLGAGRLGPLGCPGKGLRNGADLRHGQGLRNLEAVVEGNG